MGRLKCVHIKRLKHYPMITLIGFPCTSNDWGTKLVIKCSIYLHNGQKSRKILLRISVDDLLNCHLLNVGSIGGVTRRRQVSPEEKLFLQNGVSSLSPAHVFVNFWDRDLSREIWQVHWVILSGLTIILNILYMFTCAFIWKSLNLIGLSILFFNSRVGCIRSWGLPWSRRRQSKR